MKTKILGILVLSIFSLCLVSGVTAADNCIPIQIKEPKEKWRVVCSGEEFHIVLKGNPTTGYEWIADYDPQYIELVNQKYIPNNLNSCGSGGIYIFTFKALKTGNTDIGMKYLRPWENCVPAKEIVYHLKIIKDIHDFK